MLAAFILPTFGLGDVVTFVLDHLPAFGLAGGAGLVVAAIVLTIFVPAAIPFIRAALDAVLKGLTWLVGTTAGRVILAVVAAFLVGFWTRGAFDRSADLRRQLADQRAATETAQAAAAQARLQAAMVDQVNADAARRAESAEADASDYAEQAADLEDQIEAEQRAATPAKPARSYPLTATDVAAFLRIGAPRAVKP